MMTEEAPFGRGVGGISAGVVGVEGSEEGIAVGEGIVSMVQAEVSITVRKTMSILIIEAYSFFIFITSTLFAVGCDYILIS